MKVFVQNEAGSSTKHHHNEKTLELMRTATVELPYPYAYGFILETTAEDGGNVDCYVLTQRPLRTGQIVDCEPVALMEQFEDGQIDHNVIVVFPGEEHLFDDAARQALTHFVNHVFEHRPGKKIKAGDFRSREEALKFVAERDDTKNAQAPNRANDAVLGPESGKNRRN
jgi:inorganic pyrophosphatase